MVDNIRLPRFHPGEQVRLVSPGPEKGKQAIIIGVIEPKTGDFVYRYRVRFPDGVESTFFGFELQPFQQQGDAA